MHRSVVPFLFFFQAEDGIRDGHVTGVQTCALPILQRSCFLAPVWASRESRDCAGGFAAPRRLPPHSNEQLSTVTFRRWARWNRLAPPRCVVLGFWAETPRSRSSGFSWGVESGPAMLQ